MLRLRDLFPSTYKGDIFMYQTKFRTWTARNRLSAALIGIRDYDEPDCKNFVIDSYEQLIATVDLALRIFISDKSWKPTIPDFQDDDSKTAWVNDLSNEAISMHVQKYGLPLNNNRTLYRRSYSRRYGRDLCIPLDYIVDEVYEILILFLIWRYLINDNFQEYFAILKFELARLGIVEDNCFSIGEEKEERAIQELLLQCSKNHMLTSTQEIDFNDKSLRYKYTVDSLSIALQMQLYDLIRLGTNEPEGAYSFLCKTCGQRFIRHHANRTLCDFCRTPSEKNKSCRKRKRDRVQSSSASDPVE